MKDQKIILIQINGHVQSMTQIAYHYRSYFPRIISYLIVGPSLYRCCAFGIIGLI